MRWSVLCTVGFLLAAPSLNRAQPAQSGDAKQAKWMLGPFTRPQKAQPVITARPESVFTDPILGKPVHWEALHTFNPAAIVRDGKIYVLYRAEDDSGTMQIGMHTSRLGLAVSDDGLHFQREAAPVFYPAKDSEQAREWPGGTEDPRIVESPDGGYVITYTQWNQETYRVGVATSPDLHTWTKHGPAFGMGKYAGLKYKSAGIVTECVTKGRCVAAKIGTAKSGRHYWMYWGEGEIHLATSDDLVHWTPVEGADGEPKVLMRARPHRFDSGLPEVGPPPVLTGDGIVLVYNGKNAAGANGKNAAGADGKNAEGMRRVRGAIRSWLRVLTRWDRRSLRRMIRRSCWRGRTRRSSSRSCHGNRAANMRRGPPLPRGWCGSAADGCSITAARTRGWAWR